MRINIKAIGMELTGALREYIETKVGGLSKFIGHVNESTMIEVEIVKTTSHHKSGDIFKVMMNVVRPGVKMLREEVTSSDMYAAIDMAKDKVVDILNNNKDKQKSLFKRGGRAIKNLLRGFSK